MALFVSIIIFCSSCNTNDTPNPGGSMSNNSKNSSINSNNIANSEKANTPSPTDKVSYSNTSANNEEKISGLQKKGLKIIENQSFNIELEKWGKVRFVSGKISVNGTDKLQFYLVGENEKILYHFLDFPGNKWPMFFELKAISFKDANKDGLRDVIVIADYLTGVGAQGAIPFHVGGIYFQKEKEFINLPELDKEINDAKKNENIDMIVKFIEGKEIKISKLDH